MLPKHRMVMFGGKVLAMSQLVTLHRGQMNHGHLNLVNQLHIQIQDSVLQQVR